MNALLFVYGTLKSGCCNHDQLAAQTLVGPATTVPGYRLHDMGGYPGITACAEARDGVVGEVWSVDAAALRRLDAFEGVREGLYRRERVPLLPPFSDERVEAYFPVKSLRDRPVVGSTWRE